MPYLPTVTAVDPLPEDTARLTLEDGRAVFILAAHCPALLPPLPGEDQHAPRLFLEDLGTPTAPAYRIPARLCVPLAAALRLCRVPAGLPGEGEA